MTTGKYMQTASFVAGLPETTQNDVTIPMCKIPVAIGPPIILEFSLHRTKFAPASELRKVKKKNGMLNICIWQSV
jgi:hypothetical protein